MKKSLLALTLLAAAPFAASAAEGVSYNYVEGGYVASKISGPDADGWAIGGSGAIAPKRLFALSTRGTQRHDQPRYAAGDAFLFGPETRGLPAEVLEMLPLEQRLRLPMRPDNRSLNLSNSVAVLVYEAWRQLDFIGGA